MRVRTPVEHAGAGGLRGAILALAATLAFTAGAAEGEAEASTIYGVSPGNRLVRFDSASPGNIPGGVVIFGFQSAGERIIGIDFRPRTGQLYAVTVPIGAPSDALLRTYSINPVTGLATFVGSVPASTVPGAADVPTGLDFNPTVDRIRVVNVINENFRINPNNGSLAGNDTDLTDFPLLTPSVAEIVAEAYDRNWDRANAATIPTTLYGIARATNSLVIQGGLNGAGPGGPNGGVLTTVGSLGVTLDAGAGAGFDIEAGGPAYAALTSGGVTRLYTVNLGTGAATLVGTIGDGALQMTGLAIVPRSLAVAGAGPGGGPHVKVFDPSTGAAVASFFAFDPSFTGGVRVALGDINGDGVADIVVGAGPGGGPHVRVIDGKTGTQLPGPIGSFFAFDPSFTGGVYVAAGDVDGDGFQDVIVGAGPGGGPHVRAFSGKDGTELASFFAYDPAFSGGVRVAAADINLDGRAEIVTGAGPGGGAHVRVFDGTGAPFSSGAFSNSFFAYPPSFTGGVFVAAGDVNGDGIPDIITGAGPGGGPHVRAFSGKDGSELASFFAYEAAFTGGVTVGVADANNDGRYEILTLPGPGRPSDLRAIDLGPNVVQTLTAFPPAFEGGAFVGGIRR
jgi:uncharacterized protein DUF4394/VCBS repeat protein/FG-GAP repeat protein